MSNSMPIAMLVAAGLLSSKVTATASGYITYGNTVVNYTTYNLSPGADLSYANLYGANLPYADLNGTKLYKAGLQYAVLTGANLSDANLTQAPMPSVILTNANLSSANFFQASLVGADLAGTNLTGAILMSANLTGANLTGANLTGSYLLNANLTGATLSYADWDDFVNNSGAALIGAYNYDTNLINYAGPAPVPEPSTYGLIGIAALGAAFATRRKLKTK